MSKAVAWSSAKLAAKKLAPVFESKGWQWGMLNSEDKIPTEKEIVEAFIDLQKHTLDRKNASVYSGRLAVLKRGQVFTFGLEKYLKWGEDNG